MRVTIVGGPGSGKSTLAKKISDKLKIPYLQIDRLWFESGGNNLKENDEQEKERVRSFIKEKVVEFIKQDNWVSDGWYRRVQPLIAKRADIIIFLDIPLGKRIWNHIKRMFKNERHAELTKKDDLIFIFEIIRRQFLKMPELRKFIIENKDKVIVLKNFKEMNNYINKL
jgi:adenylate kinase family enzyme